MSQDIQILEIKEKLPSNSPVSATITVNAFNCSNEFAILVFFAAVSLLMLMTKCRLKMQINSKWSLIECDAKPCLCATIVGYLLYPLNIFELL